jgi:hypothetical protein
MPSGGHARSGPPANPLSATTERKKETWTTLPAEGRGRRAAPKFPFDQQSQFESVVWKSLWKKPQAVMWDRLGMLFQVAAYTRAFTESVEPGAPASLKTSVLRMEDTLGLSIVGLNQLRWRIAEDELVGQRAVKPAGVEQSGPVRRLRAS